LPGADEIARALPRPPARDVPCVEALDADLAVLHLLENGGAEIFLSADPQGRSRLETMVGPDRARALAIHPAMQMKQRVPLASSWLVCMMHWQGLSTAEIARRVRVSGPTVRRWVKDGPK